jgi:hypothetical protein
VRKKLDKAASNTKEVRRTGVAFFRVETPALVKYVGTKQQRVNDDVGTVEFSLCFQDRCRPEIRRAGLQAWLGQSRFPGLA